MTATMIVYRFAFGWSLTMGIVLAALAGLSSGVDLWVDSALSVVSFVLARGAARQHEFHGHPTKPIDHEAIA